MELQDFIANFAEQFNETETSEFSAETEFKDLAEWGSMMEQAIIAMIDAEYGVLVKWDEVRKAETIEDLFNTVKGYKA